MLIKELNNLAGYGFSRDCLFETGKDHDIMRFYIYNDGLEEPVFHVIIDGEYRDICICLFEPRYYQYNKSKNIGLLNLHQLDKFLRQPNERHPEKSNWQEMVDWWSGNYTESKYTQGILQPNYKKLDANPIKRRSLARMIKAKFYA